VQVKPIREMPEPDTLSYGVTVQETRPMIGVPATRPRYSVADNSPEAAAERNVPRNPRPLCREFVPTEGASAFWCATCRWNQPMHDDERHRAAIAAELLRIQPEEV
jgi:hypothetical protein